MWQTGSSALTRDGTWAFGAQRLNHWTTREVPLLIFFKKDFIFYVGVELIDNVLVSSVQQTDSVVYIYIDTYSFPDSFLAVLILMFKLSHIWPVAACRGWLLCL